jgi:ketosteroid isomerase-like protein
MHAIMEIQKPIVILNEGIAVLISDWRLTGTLQNGESFPEQDRTFDIIKKQSDGTWLIVLDGPWGAQEYKKSSSGNQVDANDY